MSLGRLSAAYVSTISARKKIKPAISTGLRHYRTWVPHPKRPLLAFRVG